MLNPGYRVIVKKQKMKCEPGQTFVCPKCKNIVLEAAAERFRVRCKHCGRWVYAEKIENIEESDTVI
jgi:DNA-directed RNA polymerase subunit RPC12/RpoP